MNIAPVLLFTYKRLDTLKTTVEALANNELANDSELFVFSDAAKFEKDIVIVNQVRDYIKTITGFKKITIVEARENKGLANSIIDGVTAVLNKFDRVIVLEDDLSTTANFLTFMNTCLMQYQYEPAAFSISGYSFNLGQSNADHDDAYFLRRGWSWGWATWKDRWADVDWAVKDYEQFKVDSRARREFAVGGSDLNKMLADQMEGRLDSWAIRWFYHQFRKKGLTVYPVFSKVFNNGFDQDATHTSGSGRRYLPALDKEERMTFSLPQKVTVNQFYQKKFMLKMGLMSRIVSKAETILQMVFK